MNLFKIGTPLIEVIDKISESNISSQSKNCIINFCRSELEYGDSTISNELELAMINSWFLDEKNIRMPVISDKYKLADNFSAGNKIFEEYKSPDGERILRCVSFDNEGNINKVRLSYSPCSLKDMLENGGVEDIFIDYNNDGFVNARTIQKTTVDEKGIKSSKMLYDTNLDGKFD